MEIVENQNQNQNQEPVEIEVPEGFQQIIIEFINDLKTTFPEYIDNINKYCNFYKDQTDTECVEQTRFIFDHCSRIFPERFFDILYKKNEIFLKESNINTEFLPGIEFKYFWCCDITETIQDTIWKYLQAILISIVGVNGLTNKNNDIFTDSLKLFETVNESSFRKGLEDTMINLQPLFDTLEKEQININNEEPWKSTEPDIKMDNINNTNNTFDNVPYNINDLIGGKLGSLAKELAEETTRDLNIDINETTSPTDIFQQLFKNPGKLMGLVKNISDKLNTHVASGEIDQNELMTEAVEMLGKMKNIPGMGNIQEMFSKMGQDTKENGKGMPNMQDMISKMTQSMTQNGGEDNENGGFDLASLANMVGLNKGTKINANAMEQKNKNIRMKEMLKKRMEEKQLNKILNEAHKEMILNESKKLTIHANTDDELITIFSTGEKVEKTPRNAKQKKEKQKK